MTNQTIRPPTMRVAVELVFIRDCEECRRVAETTAVAAIHDGSVTAIRLTVRKNHAHIVKDESGAPQHLERTSNASTVQTDGQKALFTPTPQSDTNGFDSSMR